jgi:hypothetical protein
VEAALGHRQVEQWVQKIHFALRDEAAGKSAVVQGKGNETALIAKLGGSDMVGDQILALILSKRRRTTSSQRLPIGTRSAAPALYW